MIFQRSRIINKIYASSVLKLLTGPLKIYCQYLLPVGISFAKNVGTDNLKKKLKLMVPVVCFQNASSMVVMLLFHILFSCFILRMKLMKKMESIIIINICNGIQNNLPIQTKTSNGAQTQHVNTSQKNHITQLKT